MLFAILAVSEEPPVPVPKKLRECLNSKVRRKQARIQINMYVSFDPDPFDDFKEPVSVELLASVDMFPLADG